MAEIIARFADGRLLVQEDKLCEDDYMTSGIFLRIGHVRTVEKVLSVDTDYSKYGLITNLDEARPYKDGVYVLMRRGSLGLGGTVSGGVVSGTATLGLMSAITSGLNLLSEVLSGRSISGQVTITANVIGY